MLSSPFRVMRGHPAAPTSSVSKLSGSRARGKVCGGALERIGD